MCARGFAAVCVSSDTETLGPRPASGYVPKGRRLWGRAAARAGRRKRYTEPGGRPQGPPLRGRREGNGGSGGAGGRKGRPYGDEGKGMPGPAGRSGTGPYGGAEQSPPGGYVPPTVSGFHFSWADMHRSPHRIPAFRRGGYHPPAAPDIGFLCGGLEPSPASDTRPFVGAHSVRPRLCGCSRPPPTRKRWGRGPGLGTPQGAAGCGAGWPRGRVEGKGILNPAGGREGRPYGGEGKEIPGPSG